MKTNILILCAGKGTRWKRDCPKQLVSIAGEPLLKRTLRQIEKTRYKSIIISHLSEFNQYGDCFEPEKRCCITETLLSTKELWEDKTIVLLGDVLWTSSVLSQVMEHDGLLMIFGNFNEIFALSFLKESWEQVETTLCRVIEGAENKENPGKLWQFYNALCGLKNLNYRQKWNYNIFTVVASSGTSKSEKTGQYTQDFDYVENYERFLELNPWAR